MIATTERIRISPKLYALVLLTLIAAGCSAASDGSSPTSTIATAQLTAEGAPVTICLEECVFEGSGANRGLGCAAAIRGTTRVFDAEGATLSRIDWRLDPGWIVRPGETFLYDGCCFDESVKERRARMETEFAWDDVNCPQS